MVNITFLFHLNDTKPSGNIEYCFSQHLAFSQGQIATHIGKVLSEIFTPIPLTFSQGQMLTHTGTVWSETFAPVPWSFLTRPGTNSHVHRHSLVLRLLSQFFGAFSQYQVPIHTGKSPCWLQQFPLFYFLNVGIPI
jgi:hypothetical protein